MRDAVAAEWIKLRTSPAARYCLMAAAAMLPVAVLIAWAAAQAWDALPAGEKAGSISSLPRFAGWGMTLALGVMGALSVSREYASGMIRTTFAALPRRGRVLAAKAVVCGAVAPVTALAVLVAVWWATRAVLGDRAMEGVPGPFSEEWWPIAAMAAEAAVFALLGLGLAALARSAVASVAALGALWYLLPMVVQFLPEPWNERAGSVLPGGLAAQIASPASAAGSVYGDLLPPWGAALAMALWALVPLVAAWPLLRVRDA
ncbi:ABC transporter permease subunit [Nocardiopsis chromatogenes]|uniref:ABC transporter permease subunit n=1 Tax=Nocardiopsis chromatogenes TaxID=280239 RepID=UPI00034844AE|nr:ABC transporter permease subunit [Nocardiopsis chromatogenes]